MGFLQMLGLAVLPGLGILIGTLISEKKNLSDRVSAAALHWIAGTMLGFSIGRDSRYPTAFIICLRNDFRVAHSMVAVYTRINGKIC